MSYFDNSPVIDQESMYLRLFLERQALLKSDLPIKSILNYWSETTFECHSFPIFHTDKPIDIMNRYCDVFPREYKELVKEVKDINETLYNENGMSKEKINMAKLKIPLLVYRAMTELEPEFWDGNKGVKWLESNVKPLKVGNV